VTILFYVAHLSHAYATLAFVPFFLAHGLVFGLLVAYTRSIVPGIVLHGVSDFVVLPMQYGVIPSAGSGPLFGRAGYRSLREPRRSRRSDSLRRQRRMRGWRRPDDERTSESMFRASTAQPTPCSGRRAAPPLMPEVSGYEGR